MQFVPTSNVNFTTGNAYADMLEGNLSQINQANFNRLNDISYHTYEGFIQDSWKVIEKAHDRSGLRMTHFTPWSDDEGFGYSVFTPSQYQNQACTAAPTFCGFNWHSRNSAVPSGRIPDARPFLAAALRRCLRRFRQRQHCSPRRLGTVLLSLRPIHKRTGYSAGSANITVTPNSIGNKQLLVSNLGHSDSRASPALPVPWMLRTIRQPYTDSYSFTISQRTPARGLLEVGYVGNQSNDLQSTGGYGSNLNLVPVGAMLSAVNPSLANANNYRPYLGYGDINRATNNLYANYNAFQMTWAHQDSHAIIQLNYTLGKALGIVNNGGGGGGHSVR